MKEMLAGALALTLLSPALAADDALQVLRACTRAVTRDPPSGRNVAFWPGKRPASAGRYATQSRPQQIPRAVLADLR